MARYIQFTTSDGATLLMETTEVERDRGGEIKAGLGEKARHEITKAQASFEEAMMRTVRRTAQAFVEQLADLSKAPEEAEISFGLKAIGEAGNVAIGKAGGETNLTVKLVWKKDSQ